MNCIQPGQSQLVPFKIKIKAITLILTTLGITMLYSTLAIKFKWNWIHACNPSYKLIKGKILSRKQRDNRI